VARKVGLKTLDLSRVEDVLRDARSEQHDVYAPLSEIRPGIRDPLAPLEDRFCVSIGASAGTKPVGLSPNALEQLCGLAGVPPNFLERVPTSLALKLLRSCLETTEHSDGRRFLLRLKTSGPPRLRAILPQSYVRFDDLDVFKELRAAAEGRDFKAVRVNITDDVLFLRLAKEDALNLGPRQQPDPALAGIDLITSETGAHKLELRHCLLRLVCENGLTTMASAGKAFRSRFSSIERELLQEAFRKTLEDSIRKGSEIAARLAQTRSSYIQDPRAELEAIFRKYKLGTTRGRIGRWVVQEVLRNLSMFGVAKFDLIQAFTAVARGLEHAARTRIEDAMGSYLVAGSGLY